MVFGELTIAYLFLGGSAAGAFALMSCIDFRLALARARHGVRGSERLRFAGCGIVSSGRLGRFSYAAALLMLAVGLVCLVADLGRPQAFYLLFLHPTVSVMSVGAFSLAALFACASLAAIDAFFVLGPVVRRAACVAKALGLPLSLVVAAYTGLLLSEATGVHLWGSPLLPVLFFLSSASCGAAVLLLGVVACESRFGPGTEDGALAGRVVRLDSAIIVLELLAAAAYVLLGWGAYADRPFEALFAGEAAWAFLLGFVGCGMLAPFAMEVTLGRRPSAFRVAIIATMVLIGGISLRYSLVSAAAHVVF